MKRCMSFSNVLIFYWHPEKNFRHSISRSKLKKENKFFVSILDKILDFNKILFVYLSMRKFYKGDVQYGIY